MDTACLAGAGKEVHVHYHHFRIALIRDRRGMRAVTVACSRAARTQWYALAISPPTPADRPVRGVLHVLGKSWIGGRTMAVAPLEDE